MLIRTNQIYLQSCNSRSSLLLELLDDVSDVSLDFFVHPPVARGRTGRAVDVFDDCIHWAVGVRVAILILEVLIL